MPKVTSKAKEESTIAKILGRILNRETILAVVAVGTALSSLMWYFSHKNHVVATVLTGDARLDEESEVSLLIAPVKLKITNLGEGPIAFTGLHFAFNDPRSKENDCDRWISVGERAVFNKVIAIDTGDAVEIDGEFSVPVNFLPSEMCLVAYWRDQNEYQRSYLASVGRFESYTPYTIENIDGKVTVNGGLKDVVSIFPAKRCTLVFSEEYCI